MGFEGRMPRLVACGGRGQTYQDFCTAIGHRHGDAWVALWVDSEEPVGDLEACWQHLSRSDGWTQPAGVSDEEVLLMVTCMETWIVADRKALRIHYGADLNVSALPALSDLEARLRHEVQEGLERATKGHPGGYRKGRRAFALLAAVDPKTVEAHCSAMARCRRILGARL
jgi:hypothetical protein